MPQGLTKYPIGAMTTSSTDVAMWPYANERLRDIHAMEVIALLV